MIQTEKEFIDILEQKLKDLKLIEAHNCLKASVNGNRKKELLSTMIKNIQMKSSNKEMFEIYDTILDITLREKQNMPSNIIFTIAFQLPILIIGSYWSIDEQKAKYFVRIKDDLFKCFSLIDNNEKISASNNESEDVTTKHLKCLMNFFITNNFDKETIDYYNGFVLYNKEMCSDEWLAKFWNTNHFVPIQNKDDLIEFYKNEIRKLDAKAKKAKSGINSIISYRRRVLNPPDTSLKEAIDQKYENKIGDQDYIKLIAQRILESYPKYKRKIKLLSYMDVKYLLREIKVKFGVEECLKLCEDLLSNNKIAIKYHFAKFRILFYNPIDFILENHKDDADIVIKYLKEHPEFLNYLFKNNVYYSSYCSNLVKRLMIYFERMDAIELTDMSYNLYKSCNKKLDNLELSLKIWKNYNYLFSNDKAVLFYISEIKKLGSYAKENLIQLHKGREKFLIKNTCQRKLIKFIKDNGNEVNICELASKFPQTKKSDYKLLLNHDYIINNENYITHLDFLNDKDSEIESLLSYVDKFVADDNIHHIADLQYYIHITNPLLLNKLKISNAKSLFKIIKIVCPEKFSFNYPFVAQDKINIDTQIDRVRAFISGFDKVSFDEINQYIAKNRLRKISIVELVTSLDYFLTDNNILEKEQTLNIDKYQINFIKKIIANNMANNRFIVLNDQILNMCKPSIPSINKWLMYSIINKKLDNYKCLIYKQKNSNEKMIITNSNSDGENAKLFLKNEKDLMNMDDIEFYKYLRAKGLAD